VIHVVSATGLPKKVRNSLWLCEFFPVKLWVFDGSSQQDAMSGSSDPFVVFMVQQVVSVYFFDATFCVVLIMTQKTAPAEPWKVADKTPVQKKTINPTWNHRMTFSIALDASQTVASPDKVHAIMFVAPQFFIFLPT
jgi:quinol-cytochrome oxidoreductase complex cytochrome b subunit